MKTLIKKLLLLLPFAIASLCSTEQSQMPRLMEKKDQRSFTKRVFGRKSRKTRMALTRKREKIEKKVLQSLNSDILESIEDQENEYKDHRKPDQGTETGGFRRARAARGRDSTWSKRPRVARRGSGGFVHLTQHEKWYMFVHELIHGSS